MREVDAIKKNLHSSMRNKMKWKSTALLLKSSRHYNVIDQKCIFFKDNIASTVQKKKCILNLLWCKDVLKISSYYYINYFLFGKNSLGLADEHQLLVFKPSYEMVFNYDRCGFFGSSSAINALQWCAWVRFRNLILLADIIVEHLERLTTTFNF